MSDRLSASDWATARGDKWHGQLSGMEAMLASVDGPLIRALRLDAPWRIADVGCGGGGTTLEIQRRAPAGSVVHGFDISPALIEAARTRQSSVDVDVTFERIDVTTTPAPKVLYDRLVSRFGIMFYDDPPAAFANLARWLAPGGRFAFAVWGRPDQNPWASSLREVLAQVTDVPPSDPEAPGPFRYASVDKLLGLLDGAGLTDLEVQDWRGSLPIGGELPVAEAVRFAFASFAIAETLAEADDEAREAAHQALTALYSQHEKDGAVWLDARVHICTGSRPASG